MASEVEFIEIVSKVSGKGEIRSLGTILDELMARATEAGANVDDLAGRVEKLGKKVADTNPYDIFMSKLKQISAYTIAGVGIKQVISTFASFDDVARKVQATTGSTAEQMVALREQAKQLGSTTSWSASEAAEAQFEFAKAGFTNNEILAATPGILNTATSAQMGLAEATEITAGTLRMFGLTADKSTLVGDMLAKTASSTSTNVKELAESLKYCGVGSRNFRLDLKQTLGILGKLGDASLKGSSAGTAMQSLFSVLQNSKKADKLISIGVQLTEDGSYRNLLDIIEDIKNKTKTMAKAQREAFINDVFGEQAGQAITRLMKIPKEEFDKTINKIGNSGGFSAKMAEIMNGGVGGGFRNLQSAVEGLCIAFGQYLAPAVGMAVAGVTGFVGILSSAVEWLNSSSIAGGILGSTIMGIATGYLAYQAVIAGVAMWEKILGIATAVKNGIMVASNIAVAGATIAYGLFSGQIGLATIATWAFNTAMGIATAPIALVIAGVIGLATGFVILYKKCDWFRKLIDPLINKLKQLWEWIKKIKFIKGAIDAGKEVHNNTRDSVLAKTNGKNAIVPPPPAKIGGVSTPDFNGGAIAGVGKGINTDYLIAGSGKKGKGRSSRGKGKRAIAGTGKRGKKNKKKDHIKSGVGRGKNQEYVHNGYYLRGNKPKGNSPKTGGTAEKRSKNEYKNNNENIYTSSSSKDEKETFEEKIYDTLLSIKNILTTRIDKNSKNITSNESKNNIEINIYKENPRDIISDVVDHLEIALGNIKGE